jgi:hypothetical protein
MARTFWELEELGRVQLSKSFYLRDFLHSEIAAFHCLRNIPVDPELAILTGRKLCEQVLEPLQETFGRIHIRSGYRSPDLNRFGNERGLKCASNVATAADHIWDQRDAEGNVGACATIVLPWFHNQRRPDEWPKLARWLHDHLDYDRIVFFTHQTSLNISVRDNPRREIRSYRSPRGRLILGPGAGEHPVDHDGYPDFRGALTPLDEIEWQPSLSCNPLQFLHSDSLPRWTNPRHHKRPRTQVDERPCVSGELFEG